MEALQGERPPGPATAGALRCALALAPQHTGPQRPGPHPRAPSAPGPRYRCRATDFRRCAPLNRASRSFEPVAESAGLASDRALSPSWAMLTAHGPAASRDKATVRLLGEASTSPGFDRGQFHGAVPCRKLWLVLSRFQEPARTARIGRAESGNLARPPFTTTPNRTAVLTQPSARQRPVTSHYRTPRRHAAGL